MRKAMILMAYFGLACPLWAADPLIGTWKLNVAESNYWALQRTTVRELITNYRELSDGYIEVTVTGTQVNGLPISLKSTFPRQGGGTISAEGISYIVTVIGSYNFFLTVLQDGKQVLMYESKISEDGKTKRDRFRGIDANGKFYEGMEVSEKQH